MTPSRIRNVFVLAALFGASAAGVALANPPPWAHGGIHIGPPTGPAGLARAHSVVSGTIVAVKIFPASLIVETAHGERIPIAVTPSTSIFRGAGFASFAEIGRGAHVDIDVSDIAGQLVAQIIKIH